MSYDSNGFDTALSIRTISSVAKYQLLKADSRSEMSSRKNSSSSMESRVDATNDMWYENEMNKLIFISHIRCDLTYVNGSGSDSTDCEFPRMRNSQTRETHRCQMNWDYAHCKPPWKSRTQVHKYLCSVQILWSFDLFTATSTWVQLRWWSFKIFRSCDRYYMVT
jgi:hypothetical protein